MPTLVKKGTNSTVFILANRNVKCEPDIMAGVTDEELAQIKQKYGSWLKKAIKNGFMLLSDKSEQYAKDESSEVGRVPDGSTLIDPYSNNSATETVPETEKGKTDEKVQDKHLLELAGQANIENAADLTEKQLRDELDKLGMLE
jgi:hypothetical protein